MECRAGGSPALLLLGAVCVLSGLAVYGSYEHAPASTRAPALALYVPPLGLQPVGVPGPQTAPVAPPSVMMPMGSPETLMPAGLEAPVALPFVMTPTAVESPGAQMPIGQPSMDAVPQFLSPAVEPSGKEGRMGPLQAFFWGLSGSCAIGFAIMKKKLNDDLSLDSVAGGLRLPTPTLVEEAVDRVELGMLPGRAGVPAMMADTTSQDNSWRRSYDGRGGGSVGGPTMTVTEKATEKKQDFLEADPYWDQSTIPVNTFKNKDPFKGKIISNKRIVGPEAIGETCHIIMGHEGKMPYWEGQSYGVIPPGENPKKPGKPNAVRLYSIASSRYGDDMTGTTTSLCVKRATYWCPELKAEDPAKKGICSNFLCDTKPGDEVMLTGPSGKVMLIPEENPNVDLIMVATGTGIAPYRSIIRRLFVEKTPFGEVYSGLAWLFLGVNNTDSLLYDDEWQEVLKKYPDNFRLDYAMSREMKNAEGGPMYIQHKMAEYADEVFDRMNNGAILYVCGLKGMMPGITEMLEGVCTKKGLVFEDKLKEWKKAGQWRVEVY